LLSIETYEKLGDGFNYEHNPSKLASYASIKNLRPLLRDLNPQIPPQYALTDNQSHITIYSTEYFHIINLDGVFQSGRTHLKMSESDKLSLRAK
jgi:hypothetical protein